MGARGPGRAPRGATLLELMVSMVILAVAMTGFVGAMNATATASSVAHRRTVETLVRTGLLDRFTVTRRQVVDGAAPNTWIVDTCLDVNSQYLARNTALDAAFACPETAHYQSWIRVVPHGERRWTLETYVERIEPGCDPSLRYASLWCVAADQLLTD